MSRQLRISLVVFAGLAVPPALAGVIVAPDVHEALSMGRARVIVELDLAAGFASEGESSEERVRSQRAAIADTQQQVLIALADSDTRLIRRPEAVPFLALEIGPAGLAILVAMPMWVSRIHLDGTATMNRREKSQGVFP